MKKFLMISLLAVAARSAFATSIVGTPFLSNTNISTESGVSSGTVVNFSLDTGGQVEADFFFISPVDASQTMVSSVIKTFPTGGAQGIFWPGLWPIGTGFGRHDGTYAFQVVPSTNGTPGTGEPLMGDPAARFTITSLDIHNINIGSSLDASEQPTFPYIFSYALAKSAKVTATVVDSSGTLVRTLISAQVQAGETLGSSTSTITWDGTTNDGKSASIGNYALTLNAADLSTSDTATPRVSSFSIVSLAGAATNPQKLFEDNAFVYPNPVRNGQGIFQMEAVRAGATLSLKIYTITGTLVRSETFPGIQPGNINNFTWDVTNQSGNKVGRGLYYYVVREQDSQGTLQTVKKMAVLP